METNKTWRTVLNPVVLKLGLVSFFADVASEMLYPVTPIFLTTVVGASVLSLGVIEGFAEGTASLLKTYAGRLSDQSGKRKVYVWSGYLLAAIAKPMIGASSSWTHVFAARAVDRLGKGIRGAPRDALLSDAVDPASRGLAFGFHRAMDSIGAACGPLLAIALIGASQSPEHLRSIYFYSFIPAMVAVLIAMSLREAPVPPRVIPVSAPALLNRPFKTYLCAWGAFSLTNSSDVFLLLRAQQSGLSLTSTILLYAFYNLVYALSSPYLGHLSDRYSRKSVLIAGLGIFAFVYLGFAFATEAWQFWSLFAIYGLYMGATDGVGKAYAVDLVPKHAKATGLGALGTVTGLTTIIASSIAGLLWDTLGAQWTFFYAAAGAMVAIVILFTSALPALGHDHA